MSKYSSKDMVLLLDGYNILGTSVSLDYLAEALTEQTTPLGAEWEEHTCVGIKRAEVKQEGFFDDASDSINEALNEQQGLDRILCFGFEGNTIGKQFSGFQGAMETKYTRIASRGKMHRANVEYAGNGIAEDGRILHPLTARTADGDTESTPVDNSVQTTDGGAAYLQVTALTLGGYDNVAITVRQSADGIAWEDLTSFTVVATAPNKERKTIAGTIKQYLAVSWAFTGTGSDPSATFFVGVARN